MNHWTIGRRIIAGFVTLLLLLCTLGIVSTLLARRVTDGVRHLADDSIPGLRLTGHLVAETLRYRVINLRHVASTDPAEMAAIDQEAIAQAATILAGIKEYSDVIGNDPEERALFDRIEPLFLAYQTLVRQVRAASTEGRTAEATALFQGDAARAYASYERAVLDCREYNTRAGDAAANSAVASLATTVRVNLIVMTLAVAVGSFLGFFIVRGVTRALMALARTLGDGSNQVAAAAGQVAAASQSLAEGASEQAASLEETGSSLEEMSSMTKRNADNSAQVSTLSREARDAADHGAADMEAMTAAMDAIKQSSDDIAKIIKTIDEIAFQTNILALNAAVEAARAGEAGMGFAVVADEVRSLAQRSAQAAKETSAKIEGAISRAAQGVQISSKVSVGLQQILQKVRQVDELASEVAAASKEQSQGIAQVNLAVSQMDKVTQSNAASAEESASAGEELNAQADALKEAVQDLLHLVGASLQTPGTSRTRPQPTSRTGSHTAAASHRSIPAARTAPAPVANDGPAPANAGNGHRTQPAPKPAPVTRTITSASTLDTQRKRAELPLDGDFRDF
ncbi:MAG: MCP four helix bundle domain-containing protein [Verrucomicrobiae bacterium]|nr:MCP four helix bundle domain-containing protein [Verrucomicrobiae bacterium]